VILLLSTSDTDLLAAVPFVLVAAGHGKGDIPAALLREQVRHPGMTYTYGRPLGPHPALLHIVEQRIDDALSGLDRQAQRPHHHPAEDPPGHAHGHGQHEHAEVPR
jgi:sirohydrochlorin ferrochelatase